MRGTTGVALALALVPCTTVACADSAPTAQGSSAPSPSPSPSVVCAGEPSVLAANSLRLRSEFVTEGDLDVLVIGDGEAICRDPADPDPAPGVTISMTFVRYGKPGARSTALEAAEPIGRYDGSAPLRVSMPLLGSPCTGAVVHVGTTLPDDLLPSSRPVIGAIGGP